MPVSVAQSVLVAILLSFSTRCYLLELLHRAVPIHLQVDADTAVHGTRGHVYVDIGYTGLDDLVEDFARLLVISHSHANMLGPMPKASPHAARNSLLEIRWKIEEAVNLPSVLILNLETVPIG